MNLAKCAFSAVMLAAAVTGAMAGNVANPDAIDLKPIPVPVEMTADIDSPVTFGSNTTVVVECPDAAAADWLSRHFAEWYGVHAPKAVAGSGSSAALPKGDEAYAVKADANGVRIAAKTLAGVRWAAYSLRQLAMAARGTMTTEGRILPTLSVSDAPHLAFRGVHICWFPETRTASVERAIRLAALMKFNYCVLEPWGTYRSAKHPWWGWKDGKATKDEIRRLVALGNDLGITLIPQLNCFGHGALSRTGTLKHAVLDLDPRYEPLYEPGGWNWCLSNPETQRVLRELIAELYGDFGKPPYFHLGCDEAQPPSCPACRKQPYGELVCRHIAGLADYVKSLGARPMIWHDMLVDKADLRWKGYVAFGSASTAQMADLLPKDVLLCDWQYFDLAEGRRDFPTMAHFFENGFSVIGAPFMNKEAMRPMADFIAADAHGFGYLQTTWHRLRGRDWRDMYRYGAAAAWGTEVDGGTSQYDTRFANALRYVGHDMRLGDPLDTGDIDHQVNPASFMDD